VKLAQRLSHRRPADAEPRADLLLHQVRAGRIAAIEDLGFQPEGDLVGDAADRDAIVRGHSIPTSSDAVAETLHTGP
jgi:hypothetical protein